MLIAKKKREWPNGHSLINIECSDYLPKTTFAAAMVPLPSLPPAVAMFPFASRTPSLEIYFEILSAVIVVPLMLPLTLIGASAVPSVIVFLDSVLAVPITIPTRLADCPLIVQLTVHPDQDWLVFPPCPPMPPMAKAAVAVLVILPRLLQFVIG